jgi:spore protease
MKFSSALKLNHIFRRLYRTTGLANGYLVLYARPNRTEQNRIGVTVSKKLGKAVGKYITIEIPELTYLSGELSKIVDVVKDSLDLLLPQSNGLVLVAGVGNSDITADALGPFVASKIFSTRHLTGELQKNIGFTEPLRPMSAISTGVLGQTGLESSEYIKCIVNEIKPCCVITIDALASRSVKRLGNTIQMSDTGIAPGSGINNKRKRIDEDFLGVPVIAIGVPTVVDAITLAESVFGTSSEKETGVDMIVTPKDIDVLIKNSADLIATSINLSLQKSLSYDELKFLL